MVRPLSPARPAAAPSIRRARVKHRPARARNEKQKGETVIWAVSAAAAMTGLLALSWWLVRREGGKWRRFREAQGEPEVVARRVAANRRRAQQGPLSLMVFRSSTNRWESVVNIGRRRGSAERDQEAARPGRRRSRGIMMMSCWPVILLDSLTRF
jgi:hypothetical protein